MLAKIRWESALRLPERLSIPPTSAYALTPRRLPCFPQAREGAGHRTRAHRLSCFAKAKGGEQRGEEGSGVSEREPGAIKAVDGDPGVRSGWSILGSSGGGIDCREKGTGHSTMKYVIVTGGVVSGLGKGVTASSIGVILKACGLRCTSIKIGTPFSSSSLSPSPALSIAPSRL